MEDGHHRHDPEDDVVASGTPHHTRASYLLQFQKALGSPSMQHKGHQRDDPKEHGREDLCSGGGTPGQLEAQKGDGVCCSAGSIHAKDR